MFSFVRVLNSSPLKLCSMNIIQMSTGLCWQERLTCLRERQWACMLLTFFNFPSDFPVTTSIFLPATLLEIWILHRTFRIYIYCYQKISLHLQGDPILPAQHHCISFWKKFLVQDITLAALGLISKHMSTTNANCRPGDISVLPH